jgi:NTE family protein
VLSGGGARGAYEGGVLRYLFEEIEPRLDRPLRFDLVLGTSVGAIHACFVAATAHLGSERGALLQDTWRRLHLEQILRASPKEIMLFPRRALSLLQARSRILSDDPPDRLYGLVDIGSLERVVRAAVPWDEISRNIGEGRIEGLCLAATQVSTGRVIAFIEGARIDQRLWAHDPTVVPRDRSMRWRPRRSRAVPRHPGGRGLLSRRRSAS